MERDINSYNLNDINSISDLPYAQEKNEYQKMQEYINKIKEYRMNNYMNCILSGSFCDFLMDGEWKIGYILKKENSYVIILDINMYYLCGQRQEYQMSYSSNITYFRKHTKPSLENLVSERDKKNKSVEKINLLLSKKDIFKYGKNDNDPKTIFEIYYFLHSILYFSIDYSICRSKDKNSGVEEGFRIILIVLEYLSEFYHYINQNFEDFLNYKNNMVDSELSDLVLFDKKYAIFSFWDDANILMNKIFIKNQNYFVWFIESEKVLQKIMPSSPNLKKIGAKDKLICPLYESQIDFYKLQNYNYITKNGNILKLKKICVEDAYKNKVIEINEYKIPTYILAYLIDYFYSLGGYSILFSLCRENYNIKIAADIFNNICYGIQLTNNFRNLYESQRNGINTILFKFLDSINEDTLKNYSKDDIVKFLKRGTELYPNINSKSTYIFEDLYLRYMLKYINFAKNGKQLLKAINDIDNILYSIEYNQLFKNNIKGGNDSEVKENDPKFSNKDPLIKEINYKTFCQNCNNYQIIDIVLKENDIHIEILKQFAPIIFIMYQNNFGDNHPQTNQEKIEKKKNLIFNMILNKLKKSEKNNLGEFMQIEKIICDFCQVLTDDDKYLIFSEIKFIFEDSIYNQKNTFKEIFDFIINYSSIAVKKTNIYKRQVNNNFVDINAKDDADANIIQSEEQNQEINNNNFDEKKYFGLELIYGFLSLEHYDQFQMSFKQKMELINKASDGIIKIISSVKSPNLAINVILYKIFNSIQTKKDVLQHLLLLNKLLNYSKIDNFLLEFNNYFEEYLKKHELIIILIDELSSFIEQLKQNNIGIINNPNPNEIDINQIEYDNNQNEEGFLDENSNIKTRTKTIFNVILKYKNTNYDFNKIKSFFFLLINYNEFIKNILYKYLSESINHFPKDFLFYLYSNIISKKELFTINNSFTYQVCKNIIIQMNKINNNLYLMNNKDIGILINKSDIKNEFIIGIDLLWDLLLNQEQNIDANIINDVTDFICNLYFGVRIKNTNNINKDYEECWIYIINNISDKLKKCLEKKDKNVKAIKCLISLIKKIIEKSNKRNGEIIKDISEIKKESQFINNNSKKEPKEFTFVKMTNDNSIVYDIKINEKDYFYILRYTLSSLYKIPVNQIGIIAYQNNLGKVKKITHQHLDKLSKTTSIKIEYNYLKDFENNMYDQLNRLTEWDSKSKKKIPLLIEVKTLDPCKDIMKFNPIDIIYKKTNISLLFMNLLKEGDAPYTFDVLCLIRGNKNNNNSNIICTEIDNIIMNKSKNMNLFNFQNASIYYISYIITNLSNVIQVRLSPQFINYFLKTNIWNNCIKNLNIIKDDYIPEDIKNMPSLGELYEKYNLVNNLVNIYLSIAENIGINDNEIIAFITYKIVKIYNYIINENMNINLNKYGKSEGVTIDDVKNLFNETLGNINHLMINNDKILRNIIIALIRNNNNEYMKKIKYSFEYIIFDSILKNKYKSINKKIKSLILDLLNKLKNDKKNNLENQSFYNYLLDFYLTEKSFNKIMNILLEINNKNIKINNYRYENNVKILFDIITEVLSDIYGYIQNKFNPNNYICNILLPKIYNINIQNMPKNSIFNQLILGGVYKLFYTLLLLTNNSFNLPEQKNKEIIDYLYNSIIMSKCQKNILTPDNINNEDNSFEITSSFCIKEASNLFILLLFKSNFYIYENYMNYINKLTNLHNLCYWKGENLSDWKLYFKESQKSSSFVGLKNLGCTCYINSLIQTFFNIPLLRESLIKCDCPVSKQNCFYQLKIIFYSLKYLQTNYYTPNSFIENYDGQEIKVNVQMDAFEFFCDFIEKIERKIKNTKNENIIKYFFMGKQNDNLIFENCTHHRSNISQFYSIQLQVQGKKNIYESLDTLLEGEKMSGDNCIFCSQCNRKIPAVKNQNFKTLPRIFMFVLKRFEFNYQTMQKTKINDYYTFPLILDMNKYTENYIKYKKEEDNKYKLKSIIIHSGNCDAGHYYAYILDDKSNEWFEFNDIRVERFDIKNLEHEAYSKLDIISDDNGNKIEVENSRNAYILFYEKINKNNCENFEKIDAINKLLNIKCNNNNENNIKVKENKEKDDGFNLFNDNEDNINNINDLNEYDDSSNQKDEIQKILNPLNEEMFKYFVNKKLFSGEYHHFVLSLYLNILNKIINSDKSISFQESLCSNEYTSLQNEVRSFKINRKNPELSNIENYLIKKEILLLEPNNQFKNINDIDDTGISKEDEMKILELFKHLIIYFFNVMIRAREKDYLGGTVDLIKYFINNYLFCADYLVEEFSDYNNMIEYLLNCPSYDVKKLIVGIINCAMIKCVTLYEKKMRKEESLNGPKDNINQKKDIKKEKNKNKENEKKINNKKEQEMSDEELARKLQEEEIGYRNNYNQYQNNYNNLEENTNPLDRKYIPQNVMKFIYNCLYCIKNLGVSNLNESRFFYFIAYRFSLISKKTKKFLLNKALVLEFLNIILLPGISEEYHDQSKIINSMEKGFYTPSHKILNTYKKKLNGIFDKGGAFHYENYSVMLYFNLLSHERKEKAKHPYFEGAYNFENKKFIKALFFKISTKQDAFIFSYLINIRCRNPKHYKSRIDNVLYNILNILNRADYDENINYDINNNKDNYNNGMYNNNNNSNYNIDYENDFPKINPKYILLIFKRFISTTSDNKKIDEYRISNSLKYIFKVFENNTKFYNFSDMLIDFLIELFTNYFNVLNPYINEFSNNIKEVMQWVKKYPISPKLYPIEGISMYKDNNVAYKQYINEKEKMEFIEEQVRKSDKKLHKLNNIIEFRISGNDYEYEADFDLTDFRFRKGDYIYYNKKKAIVKEHLDELILIKIIEKEKGNENKPKNVNNEEDEEKYSIQDIEKTKFWVAKDDKNITIFSLE